MNSILDFVIIGISSIICGFVLGFEREIHNKPAGIKTVTLVVMGSSFFTFCSVNGFEPFKDSKVAAQIVSGVGFLGAGVILRSELKVMGLTTAATLWVAASIGMLIGTKMIIQAFIATILVALMISIFRILEQKLVSKYVSVEFAVFLDDEKQITIIKDLLDNFQIKIERFEILHEEQQIRVNLKVHSDFILFFENFIKELKKKNIKYSL
ncbi:MAG: MgtC/SapB family protein [bacterium]